MKEMIRSRSQMDQNIRKFQPLLGWPKWNVSQNQMHDVAVNLFSEKKTVQYVKNFFERVPNVN